MSRLNSFKKFDLRIRIGGVGPMAAPCLVSLSARSFPSMPTCDGQYAKEMVDDVEEERYSWRSMLIRMDESWLE